MTHYKVVDNEYNRQWYPEIIGNIYPADKVPGYVVVQEIYVDQVASG